MRVWVILLFVLLLNFNAYADEFNLQVALDKEEVTLTWNSIQPKEEDLQTQVADAPDEDDNSGPITGISNIPEEGEISEPENPSVPLEEAVNLPEEEVPENPNPDFNAVTTSAVIKTGFFSKIYLSIINAFRSIFGLETVGINIGQVSYSITRYPDTLEQSFADGVEIKRGSSNEFNCKETCTYTYTELKGTYSYSVSSIIGNEIISSERSRVIEIAAKEKAPELRCDEDSDCEPDEMCNSVGACIFKEQKYTLSININPSSGGTVEKDTDKEEFDSGDSVKLTANPILNHEFSGWNMDGNIITENPLTIIINSDKEITANFELSNDVPVCISDSECDEGKKCVENRCVIIEDIPNIECSLEMPCPDPLEECNLETNICVPKSTSSLQCNSDNMGITSSEKCNFDVGICQKKGQKTRTCVESGGNVTWSEFNSCQLPEEEKCTDGNECESGICDLDLNSCLPIEFEGGEEGEISCEDDLDNDCDGLTDDGDEDCIENLEPASPSPGASGGGSGGSGLDEGQLEISRDEPLRAVSYDEDSSKSTGIKGRGNIGVPSDYEEGTKGISLVIWIIVAVAILIVGGAAIYLFMFKFKKYKKEDIIMWIEHCRSMINDGKKVEDTIKEMNKYNLPEDFIKIVVRKLKKV